MSGPRSAPPGAGSWRCVAVDSDRTPLWVALVRSDRHPDGARVELLAEAAQREIGDDAAAVAVLGPDQQVTGLHPGPKGTAGIELWFAEYRETTHEPPAVNLMAFSGHGVRTGTLVDQQQLLELPVVDGDQVAAVRWFPATGELDQIYVQPAWRRRRVGHALIAAAAVLSHARDWPRLWSDGQRTELGEQFRNASPWRHRADDLTHVAPPMTPQGGG